ncbi:hypothetical protein TBLA_0H01280 [Henningerozyma blattae CBS 6284]|uniref:Transcription initiation factor TFIID subunit 12 domain-containing protein n=1 Tax=Henningerozyma blattae (strain ATCC 34711 / CBS 6284 / DSM 70876 / NBRC 10599 / NRRL Y-10934 / UCD 77-7) TaxID=1071380 RepID=I2H7R3_HENB6|nr:hypothetical protein TBLA_0H01280 [Tetrapisispora blattae CBS 6284]CCH62415.1 hypothetical protein TBLA_0H01280 [Tetrapisispora blattae CBS 6284]
MSDSNPSLAQQQKQLNELAENFKNLIKDAKLNGGDTTEKGKELLIKATKVKKLFTQLSNKYKNDSSSNDSTLSRSNSNSSLKNMNTPPSTSSNNSSSTPMVRSNSNLSMMIKNALTPEQNESYETLLKDFQIRAAKIKREHSDVKEKIDNISKLLNSKTNNQEALTAKRNEYLFQLKKLSKDYTELHQQFQNEKKNFYLKSAKQNSELQKVLQESHTSARTQSNINIPITNTATSNVTVTTTSTTNASASATTATTNTSGTTPPPPPVVTIPPYELNSERVLSKRKLRELVRSVSIDEHDEKDLSIDGDVEELLLDMADEFVSNITSFSCRLSRHRNSNMVNKRDIQLHVERNWNIRVPGFNADEIKSAKKWQSSNVYMHYLNSVNLAKHQGKSQQSTKKQKVLE